MTDREKLVELLGGDMCKDVCCYDCEYENNDKGCIEHIKQNMADHLIANGVTFAKDTNVPSWIPVSERLPETDTDVLMYFADDKNMTVGFLFDVDEDETMWSAYSDGGYYTDCDYTPTHWMPLPEKPKED